MSNAKAWAQNCRDVSLQIDALSEGRRLWRQYFKSLNVLLTTHLTGLQRTHSRAAKTGNSACGLFSACFSDKYYKVAYCKVGSQPTPSARTAWESQEGSL